MKIREYPELFLTIVLFIPASLCAGILYMVGQFIRVVDMVYGVLEDIFGEN